MESNHFESDRQEAFCSKIQRRHLSWQREQGFDNINMDLIVGLPGEDYAMVEYTLEQVKALDPDSLTVRSLAVKRAARLNTFKGSVSGNDL